MVLSPEVPRVAVEASLMGYWRQYVGFHGVVVGIDTFGEAGTASDFFQLFDPTAQHVATEARAAMARHGLTRHGTIGRKAAAQGTAA